MATSAAANLEDVASVDLMTELLRRMKCSTKPDKRLILVGNILVSHCYFPPYSIDSVFPKILCIFIVHFLRSDVI